MLLYWTKLIWLNSPTSEITMMYMKRSDNKVHEIMK